MKAKMKPWISRLLTAALVLTMVLSAAPQRAEAAGASLSGSGSLRAGNSVTLTFSVSGKGIVALQGALRYDSDKLEFIGMEQLIGGSWGVEMSGSTVMADDAKLSSPVNGSANIFSVTFRVKSGVSAGSKVSAGLTGITASDGSSDFSLGSASWSATILAPLSGNAKLSSLNCRNAALSPEFSAGTTYYTVTVPYEVTSLSLDYDTADSGADVYVSGNDLSVGSNTVTVSVEAEDGTMKYYTIEATRQQDPNYKAGTDAALEKLKVSSGRLSPAFSPDVTDYVVYVPFEVTEFTVSGEAHDSKALGVTEQTAALAEGSNELSVVCTAEDGTTTKTYTVHVYRMPVYKGVLPEITAPDAPTVVVPDEEPEKTYTIPAALTLPYIGQIPTYLAAGAAALVLLVLFYVLGTLVGRSAGRKKALASMAAAEKAAAPVEKAAAPVELPAAQENTPTEDARTAATDPQPAAEQCISQAGEQAEAKGEAKRDATTDAAAREPAEAGGGPAAGESGQPAAGPVKASDDDLRKISLDELLEDIRNM